MRPPRHGPTGTPRHTLAGGAVAVGAKLGLPPLASWQLHALRWGLSTNQAGELNYRTVVVTVARQQGKSTLMHALRCWRAVVWAMRTGRPQSLAVTAQSRMDALEHYLELVELVDASPLATIRHDARKSVGSERLTWHLPVGRSVDRLISSTPRAGHGLTLDMAIVDEAWAFSDLRMTQALVPAGAAVADFQLWLISTMGTEDSALLNHYVDLGRSGASDSVLYLEWSADPDDDPTDPSTWEAAMPALGTTTSAQAVADAQATMEPAEFRRAFLNIGTGSVDQLIAPHLWSRIRQEDAAVDAQALAIGVDAAPDRSCAAVAIADARGNIELVDHRAGTEWLAARVAELWQRWRPLAIVIDSLGPAHDVAADLERSSIAVTTTTTAEFTQACARHFDRIVHGQLRQRPHPLMDQAAEAVARRFIGDRWAYGRRQSGADISPMVAGALALHGATVAPRPTITSL